jgi:hypothetical protein
MSRYLLTPHTYLCITDDHAVFLDLKRDKYIGIGRAQMEALAASLKGWPQKLFPASQNGAGQEPAPVLSKLEAAGMLTTDPAVGKEATPPVVPRPDSTLVEPDLEARAHYTFAHVMHFLASAALATFALRVLRIEGAVRRVRARKQAAQPIRHEIDLEAARELVSAYFHLRPWLFGARNACLFDSLVLVEFLARHGLFATWVFGVETGPFSAHCWVQEGTTVFNDTPEHVRRYTPILAV